MNERALCQIWNSLRFRRDDLRDSEGAALQLVYRGRWQHGPGPDFRGALVARPDGSLLHGDVEVHLRATDWYSHRHHLDPAFANVILHVVLAHDGAHRVTRHDGGSSPTLALAPYLIESPADGEWPAGKWEDEPCRVSWAAHGPTRLAAILDRAGDERFLERAAVCEGEVVALGPDQALYRGLMDAMGYSQNRAPFRALAERLPLADLLAAGGDLPAGERPEGLAALLLAAAGLPAPIGHGEARGGWRIAGVRPGNHPARRIRAMASLVARHGGSFARGLCLDWPPGPPREVCRTLRKRLQVTAAPGEPGPRHVLGPGRAGDAVVNVLLPLALACARLHERRDLAEAVWTAYAAHPKLAENQTTRTMASLLAGGARPGVTRGARRQQGLIHLFKKYCDYRRCDECPAAGKAR